ncbi:MAG: CoA transferase, partial [Mycobacterium sp.]|nr:CoA transferase [Mycobacterium sp.]
QDPELDTMPGRLAISEVVINTLITELFAGSTMDDIAAEAQSRGIVCTPLAMPADVLANEHFKVRGSLVEVDLGGGLRGPIPSGFLEVDGERAGPVVGPPAVGQHTSSVFAAIASEEPRPTPSDTPPAAAPLAGLRVADFGIGGVGVEVGRMLAEYGAEVLKIESRTYPDFIRLASGGEMSPSFASSSRSKLGFGANAKNPDGNRVLKDLIARCDAVIENNSTGVMDELGLGYGELRAVNPGVVMLSSQLMGSRGPWADFRGYGPSTRAAGGIEMLWNYDDQDEPAGGVSIFPDHLCGRIGALGIMAALLGRHRATGEGAGVGAHVELAQVEATLGIVGDLLTKEALAPGTVKATGNRRERGVPWGLFRCDGVEQWVAITCRDDADWAALVKTMGSPAWATDPALATLAGRVANIDAIEQGVREWTAGGSRADIADILQEAGVPAGEMITALESTVNEQYLARGFRVEIDQPGVFGDRLLLDGPCFYGSRMTPAVIFKAPWVGEHTREVCRDVLDMSDDEIERLIADGALEVT